MALTATIFKVELQIADLERGYYGNHNLTIARHPSETDERMMVRLLAFALHASDELQFTRGLCADDEPEIWQKGPTGEVALWIDVGQPDEKRVRKACQRAEQVRLYAYGGRASQLWWEKVSPALKRFDNLRVISLPQAATRELTELARGKSMRLQCTIQEGQVWLGDAEKSVTVDLTQWYPE